ncbi:MAG: hypothetical protein DRP74_01135 [Candidatus Omnitrophota bacterium]|nr:MAG: hypothetical protein DRP74_01135 [Candidatus Omnitrophota bacterium]
MKNKRFKADFLFFSVAWLLFVICHLSFVINSAYCEEVTILFTGETHAMLYPCNCPVERDGGVARRATLLKQLREASPNLILLDTGGFFAGGLQDAYTQNVELDMARTLLNLKSMELIGYDAAAIGDDEFNFGKNFLLENLENRNLNFLTCNIVAKPGSESLPIKPYIIKDLSGIKIGIVGVTTPGAQTIAGGLGFIEPKEAIRKTIRDLKKDNADIIILLSHLGESEDLNLIKEIEGIDILLSGHVGGQSQVPRKIGSTIFTRPVWQARKLSSLWLEIEDKKIINFKEEQIRVSDIIADDPSILSILPACFCDRNCSKADSRGKCKNPGTAQAECLIEKPQEVELLVISSEDCLGCDTSATIAKLKVFIRGIKPRYLSYPDWHARRLINKLGITALPAYIFRKEVEEDPGFAQLKENIESKLGFYIVKPYFSGLNYFLDRKKTKGNLDLFISLYSRDTPKVLEGIRDFRPKIHFLADEAKEGIFITAFGRAELEEYLRCVCLEKYYPQFYQGYLCCRTKDIKSSWWQDCLDDKIEAEKIADCAKSNEAKELLRENIRLNKELEVSYGPAYLLNNQQIFGSAKPLSKEEWKDIIGK